ncbi:Rqc2 family fibronectin-binding protein [Sutcliffiella horikoshii]|uniref:Rqc2 homolog RqcH n=1 Tax=Sutcliffiella horikoshii TaxID=79883 RepID=A0A5D4TBP9_9BACI|nr:NFACT RNA binding domain-containing protein [Sutcliffiella horikoshii]TYS72789.1 fibronectin/fibrinogen-binding protein [Sutcliffiella horikoshii]
MSFDGIFTYAMTAELKEKLESGRITKIYQPYKNELILTIRSGRTNHKLLISAHPSYARMHLTEESYDNPSEPPMFCMLLRKHLEGSIITQIHQIEMDRIIVFDVKARNEIGDVSYKQLIVEIMGRHSNIIFVDKEKQMILDSIKHVPMAQNRHRSLTPGQTYVLPPVQDKLNPLEATEETVQRKLDYIGGRLDKQLVNTFAGISPLFAKEAVFRAGLANRDTLPKSFMTLVEKIKALDLSPQIITDGNKEVFYLVDLEHIKGESKSFSTLSETLDRFYFGKASRDRVKQQANDLERFISNEIQKNEKKIVKLEKTLDDARDAEKFQLYGELLTANLYQISRGDTEVTVVNYYDENAGTISITLDPQRSPSSNAQRYFNKYQKAKNSLAIVQEQIEKAKSEIQYFEMLNQQVETASPKDIQEIREELMEEGYLRMKQKRKKLKPQKPVLETYTSSDGTEILVGKNNKQNDHLTNRVARRDDVWLHTKDIPGSHVVIRSDEPSEETIKEAATIAAYFSKARHSGSVPVDYTKVRHVKKPSGSKPGFVIYEQQQTVYVTPDEEMIIGLRK